MPRRKIEEMDEARVSRASAHALEAQEERADPVSLSPEQLEAMLESSALNNALPDPPKKPGIHYLWGSMTNQYVPVQYYLKLGYRPTKPEEIPAFRHLKAHSAEYGDFVMINEMILLQAPEDVYQAYMHYVHVKRPAEEAERLKANVKAMKDEIGSDSAGRPLVEEIGEGFDTVTDRRPVNKPFE